MSHHQLMYTALAQFIVLRLFWFFFQVVLTILSNSNSFRLKTENFPAFLSVQCLESIYWTQLWGVRKKCSRPHTNTFIHSHSASDFAGYLSCSIDKYVYTQKIQFPILFWFQIRNNHSRRTKFFFYCHFCCNYTFITKCNLRFYFIVDKGQKGDTHILTTNNNNNYNNRRLINWQQ